jgi:hypothetical protein
MTKERSPIWTFLWLSLLSVLVSFSSSKWFGVSGMRLFSLLMGLEGTSALASALAPAPDELSVACQHRGLRRIVWWVFEAWQFRSTVSYFPALFYLGWFMLAASIFISSVTGTPPNESVEKVYFKNPLSANLH